MIKTRADFNSEDFPWTGQRHCC